jgi:hypothetical protein
MAERRTDQDSADKKTHGAHGRGRAKERDQFVDESTVEPDDSHDTEAGRGTAGWGSEGAGGSVIDKRPPDKGK